jgi:hypothetical protein
VPRYLQPDGHEQADQPADDVGRVDHIVTESGPRKASAKGSRKLAKPGTITGSGMRAEVGDPLSRVAEPAAAVEHAVTLARRVARERRLAVVARRRRRCRGTGSRRRRAGPFQASVASTLSSTTQIASATGSSYAGGGLPATAVGSGVRREAWARAEEGPRALSGSRTPCGPTPPNAPHGQRPASCSACSRSSRSRGRAARCTADRGGRCSPTRRDRSSWRGD